MEFDLLNIVDDRLYNKIKNQIILITHDIIDKYKHLFKCMGYHDECFHIFAMDFNLYINEKLMILEINPNPGFGDNLIYNTLKYDSSIEQILHTAWDLFLLNKNYNWLEI